MVSRIRFDGYGQSIEQCKDSLRKALALYAEYAHEGPITLGQEVYQRNLSEPEDSGFAYEGRLIAHPPIS